MMRRTMVRAAIGVGLILGARLASGAERPAGKFVEVARDEVGGHLVSQVVYAPAAKALVSWGTRIHSTKNRREMDAIRFNRSRISLRRR